MKNFIFALTTLTLSSCMVTRDITEQYIKNNIDVREVGKEQNSVTFSIFKGYSLDHSSYLEITGFKQNEEKKLVVGVDKYYRQRSRFSTEESIIAKIYYLELTEAEFLTFYNALNNISSRASSKIPNKNEQTYSDFTIKKDFFISARRIYGSSPNIFNVNLWINGEKYVMQIKLLQKQLEKFKNWNP